MSETKISLFCSNFWTSLSSASVVTGLFMAVSTPRPFMHLCAVPTLVPTLQAIAASYDISPILRYLLPHLIRAVITQNGEYFMVRFFSLNLFMSSSHPLAGSPATYCFHASRVTANTCYLRASSSFQQNADRDFCYVRPQWLVSCWVPTQKPVMLWHHLRSNCPSSHMLT